MATACASMRGKDEEKELFHFYFNRRCSRAQGSPRRKWMLDGAKDQAQKYEARGCAIAPGRLPCSGAPPSSMPT